MLRLRALPWLTAALAGFAFGGDDLSRYLHPNAKLLMGIEMRRIVASPLGNTLRTQAPKMANAGFDPFADVARILVSSPGQTTAAPERTGRPQEAPVLIAIAGQFDLDRLKKMAVQEGELVARYGHVELITPPSGKSSSMHFALMSPSLLLAGDAVSLREAIDRGSLPAAPFANANLLRRALALAETSDVWLTAAISPSEIVSSNMAAAALFADVRGMEMAVNVQKGLGIRAALNTKTPDAAQKLSGVLGMMTQFAPNQASSPEAAEFLKNLTIRAEGSTVSLSLAIDAATLERSIASMGRSILSPDKAATQRRPGASIGARAANTPPPAKAVPPERQVIRIIGADDGPIEIPLNPQH